MNPIAIAYRAVQMMPQITALREALAPTMKELPALIAALKPVIREAQPFIRELTKVWPTAWPQAKAIISYVAPEILEGVEQAFDVEWLQLSLNKMGIRIKVDGQYGAATRIAVIEFQKK